MGRPKATGRFQTREELVREVWWRWSKTGAGFTDIAIACRVSQSVVTNIIAKKEGYMTMTQVRLITGRIERFPLYVFGSTELAEMHREYDWSAEVGPREYVVEHPGINGTNTFWTLNTRRWVVGCQVTMQDLRRGADGVLEVAQVAGSPAKLRRLPREPDGCLQHHFE